jgi:hypothetical protein
MRAAACLGTACPDNILAGPVEIAPDVTGRRNAKPVRSGRQGENADAGAKPQVLSLHDLTGAGSSDQVRAARH